MGEFIWIIVEKLVNRVKARRRIRAWLQELNSVQKQLLRTCLRAAKGSRRRIFERPSERAGSGSLRNEFDAQCGLLLSTEAVTPTKNPPPGVRRYRFERWLYEYLDMHPELLEPGAESGDGAIVHVTRQVAVRAGTNWEADAGN